MNIPKNIKAAGAKLLKLDGIVTASEWERAAIVYAFTEEGTPGRHHSANNSRLNFTQFSKLGIVGLKSKDTVSKFHANWQAAVDAGEALPVGHADPFVEPDLEYPIVERTAQQAGASVPRTSTALKESKFVAEVVEEMEVSDLIPLINVAQKKVDASTPIKPVKPRDGLDTSVSALEMRAIVDDLKAAEPEWSEDVRSGAISSEIAKGIHTDLSIILELVNIAFDGELTDPSELLT